MKKIEMPRGVLLQIHEQTQKFNQAQLFHNEKEVQFFYDKNRDRIKESLEGKDKIIKDNYAVNPQGVVVTRQKKEGDEWLFLDEQKTQPAIEGVLLEGKTHEGYNTLMEDFMKEMVSVNRP